MKKTSILFVGLLAAAAWADVSVTGVSVSQRWPWDTLLNVSYTLSGVTDALDVKVRAFSGNEDLGLVPDAAIVGRTHAVAADGTYSLTIDPAQCAFAERGVMNRFRVQVSTAATSVVNPSEALYRIVDLTAANVPPVDITRCEILDHTYGSYETSPYWISNNVLGRLSSVLFLTGITNDHSFATDKLLLRKMPAGVYKVGQAGKSYFVHEVQFTNSYWIGVYEVTFKQWQHVMGGTLGGYERRPVNDKPTVKFDTVRGDAAANATYDWPTGREVNPDSFIGKIRTLTGLRFDLPTEAEWSAAAYAGAWGCGVYDGSTSADNSSKDPAWYLARGNPNASALGQPVGGAAYVGSYLPNAYGFYDMLGNVRELALDWFGTIPTSSTPLVEPEGVTHEAALAATATGHKPYRCVKGGTCGQSFTGGTVLYSRGEEAVQPDAPNDQTGFRLCLPSGR